MKFSFFKDTADSFFSNTHRVRTLIIVSVFIISSLLSYFEAFKRFELVTYDYRSVLRGLRPSQSSIAVIEISDDSVAKIGRWPWDRDWHASMIKILRELGAKAVVFDVIFSEKSDEVNDKALADAIRKTNNVFLAQVVEEIPSQKRRELLSSLPEFTDVCRGGGHINLYPDMDGVMRRIPIFINVDGKHIPQLSLGVFLGLNDLTMDQVRVHPRKIEILLPGKKMNIPLDPRGNFVINWVGRWHETFRHYSYIEVIGSYALKQKGQKPLVNLDDFKGKVCFIGTTASGLFDIRPTPLQPMYPAVGVNLTLLNNLLEDRFIRVLSWFENTLIMVLLSASLYFLTKSQDYFRNASNTILLMIGFVASGIILFLYLNVWVAMIYPMILIIFTYFCITAYNQMAVAIERAKLLKMATRDSLTGLYNIGQFKLLFRAELTTHGLRKDRSLSILMSDVDNFKKTNDTYGHLTGDAVLREVAGCFKSCCRALDVAARYGGEEFILMLPGANVDEAFKVAEKIRKTIAAKVFPHEKGEFSTTISLGITQVALDDKDPESIILRADKALYEAKHTGKNKSVTYTENIEKNPTKELK